MPESLHVPAARNSTATILAFDFGERYIGVAVGDDETRLAHPLSVIEARNDADRFTRIAELIAAWQPALLIVGQPLSIEGARHAMTERAERFSRQLGGRFRLPVRLVDERLTSIEAEHQLREAGQRGRDAADRTHAVAARLILESFFNDYALCHRTP